MRELKFRAWDTIRQKMFSAEEMGADEVQLNPDGRGFMNAHPIDKRLTEYFLQLIPLQFTGLLDKNGIEIYEGDIVKYNDYPITEIYYCVNHYRFESADFDLAEVEESEHIVVIGNVYENPELLEAVTE